MISGYVFFVYNPANHIDLWGLSPGRNAHKWAKGQIGSTRYNRDGNRGGWPWKGKYKCNLFAADADNEGNDREVIPTGIMGTHPPSARDWYSGNRIPPGFERTDNPQTGDIASDGVHVGIVSEPGETTISASSSAGAVVENDWGFRSNQDNMTFWHYK